MSQNETVTQKKFDLSVVIPVYNEEACIQQALDEWLQVLGNLGCSFQVLVLNDGSKDGTASILDAIQDDHLKIIHKTNSGHGPTILLGYQKAVLDSEWVFQVDSDREIDPEHFVGFWKRKEGYDFLVGVRQQRDQDFARKTISSVARSLINWTFSTHLKDVNCPFRLMKSEVLERSLSGLPEDTFAPNVILSGRLSGKREKVLEIPVKNTGRQTGEVSIKHFKLLKAAVKAFIQTIKIKNHGM